MSRYIDLDRAYQDAYDDVHSRAVIDEREYDLIINFLDAQPGVWISAEEQLPENPETIFAATHSEMMA